jgi:thioredoxin-related protein
MCRPQSLCLLLAIALSWSMAGSAPAQEGRDVQWRHDYNTARIEADKKGLPLLLDFGTPSCFWCKKMDETTFRDVRIVNLVNQHFVPLKINAEQDAELARKLQVDQYPTLIMAAPGGKIVYNKVGYHDADTFHDVLARIATNTTTPDWMRQHLDLAEKAVSDGDYARAFAALKTILDDSKGRSIHASAHKLMVDIEAKANDRLTKAKELLSAGKSTEAAQALTDTMLAFPGLPVAKDAGELLAKLVQTAEQRQAARAKRAAELLVQARDFYKTKDVIPCLDRCEILLASFGDLPEGMEASQLVQEIRGNQEWLQLAADTLGDRLAGVYLALADGMIKRTRPREAEIFLRKVIQAFPGTRYAESAQIRIAQLQGIPPTRVEVTQGQE